LPIYPCIYFITFSSKLSHIQTNELFLTLAISLPALYIFRIILRPLSGFAA